MRFERVIEKTAILQIEIDGETIARRLIDYFFHAPGIDERQAVIVNRRFLSFKERYDKEDLEDPVFELKGNRIIRNKDFSFSKIQKIKIAVEEDEEPNEPQMTTAIGNLESAIAEPQVPNPVPEISPIQDWMRQLDFLMSVRGALALDHGNDAANKEIERFLETGQSELVEEAGSGFVPMPHIVSRAEKQEKERKREREKKRAARAKKGPKSPEQIALDREKERLRKRAHRAMRTPEQIEQARQRDRELKRAARAKMKSIS